MNAALLLLLLTPAGASRDRDIDAFSYADEAEARRAWVASDGTPVVRVARQGDRSELEFTAPFATDPKLPRTILDRTVELNLATEGQFGLELFAEDPRAVGQVSLYFRSGEGWYAGGMGLHRKGWQTLEFSKAAFRTEGHPAGWQKIDGIRISLWRGQAHDSAVRLRRLVARRHEVAIVIPGPRDQRGSGELHAALETAQTVGGLLTDLGLGSDAIEDTAVADGALGDRRVAILAYHPDLDQPATEALEKFVQSGGKLLACYHLPGRLAKAIGFDKFKYVGQKGPGYFAEIRFVAADIPGLPASVRQASWNITAAEPASPDARVIGHWFTEKGDPTGLPAMLLSDRGAFLTHILLPDDRPGKKQLLAAILGRLDPALWPTMAESERARAGRVGHCDDLEAARRFIEASGKPEAVASLKEAVAQLAEVDARMTAKAYPEAIRAARQARESLATAYLRAQPSKAKEGRAFWNHSGTGAHPGDWDRTAKELSAAGFNMVLPNMLWGGVAHYPSDVLPRSETFAKHGDQIAQCVAAAKKHGLEVHVWKVNYNLSTAPAEFVKKLRGAGRLQVTVAGKPMDWLCPSQPENLKLEVDSMLEVARKYDVDGLHFDYIRYPGDECCYCDGCRGRFEADAGVKVEHWPKDCHSGVLRQKYHDWRCEQITRLVRTVHDETKRLRPALKISAAVFGAYPDCRESVGQDWVSWIKSGYLDFVCPMDYSDTDQPFVNLVTNQLKLVEGRIPVYPGIGAWRLNTADRVAAQIHYARQLGAPGFTLFNLDAGAAEQFLPGLTQGVGAQPAVRPHRAK